MKYNKTQKLVHNYHNLFPQIILLCFIAQKLEVVEVEETYKCEN